MAYAILGLVILALLVERFFSNRDRYQERDAYLRAINLAISEGSQERREFRQLLSEEWTRIQRPEMVHPIHAEEPEFGPPPPPDPAFAQTGRVLPEPENNGEAPE